MATLDAPNPTPEYSATPLARNRKRRWRRILLRSAGILIVLLAVAGVRAHSLALLGEAGHNLSDFFALLLSWVAAYLGERPATSTKTFGWRRAGVLAAFINAILLVAIAVLIVVSAVHRLFYPEPVEAGTMMWVAAAGVLLNGVITLLLLRGGRDLNVRSAVETKWARPFG